MYLDSEGVKARNVLGYKIVMLQIGNGLENWAIDTTCIDISTIIKYLESKRLRKVGHNIKFDYQILKVTHNIQMENIYDTMVAEYVLYTGIKQPKGFYSLEKTLLRYYDGVNPYGDQLNLFRPWTPKSTRTEMSPGQFSAAQLWYGIADIESLAIIYKRQIENLRKHKLLKTALFEMKFTLVIGDMELNGMPINTDRWLELDEWVQAEEAKALEVLNTAYPEVLNWNSHKQVGKLFKSLGIEIEIRDKKKSEETGEEIYKDSIQELIIKDQVTKFPIIGDYLRYKGLNKLRTTYGASFLKQINSVTGRIHSSFMQILVTGRTSSSKPNMQNIVSAKEDFPEGLWWRLAFQAPEDKTFIIADYTSQEMHVLADQAQDKNMLTALRNKDDLHSLTASKMYKVEVSKKVNAHLRPNGKKLNFTIPYGGGVTKIAHEFKMPVKQAQQLLDNYYAGYPSLKPHFDRVFAASMKNGYILVDRLGRKSYIGAYEEVKNLMKLAQLGAISKKQSKLLKSLTEQIRRDSQNYCIQGTSASIAKLAGIYMRQEFQRLSIDAKILLLIHDEWVVECYIQDSLRVKEVVEDCAKRAAAFFCRSIQIPAEGLITNKWNKD